MRIGGAEKGMCARQPGFGVGQAQPRPEEGFVSIIRAPLRGGIFKLELNTQVGAGRIDPAAQGRPYTDKRLVRDFKRFRLGAGVNASGEQALLHQRGD